MDLTIINQNGKLLVDSREVAEMIGKRHDWIKHSQFERAKEIISTYKLPIVLKDEVEAINSQVVLEV